MAKNTPNTHIIAPTITGLALGEILGGGNSVQRPVTEVQTMEFPEISDTQKKTKAALARAGITVRTGTRGK